MLLCHTALQQRHTESSLLEELTGFVYEGGTGREGPSFKLHDSFWFPGCLLTVSLQATKAMVTVGTSYIAGSALYMASRSAASYEHFSTVLMCAS